MHKEKMHVPCPGQVFTKGRLSLRSWHPCTVKSCGVIRSTPLPLGKSKRSSLNVENLENDDSH